MLFTGVVVVTVALVGMAVLSGMDTEREPTADFQVTVESTTLGIAHDGGDVFDVADLAVLLHGDVDEEFALSDFPEQQGDGDGRFEPGEIREHSHGASDELTVRIVHEPSNTLLFESSVDVP